MMSVSYKMMCLLNKNGKQSLTSDTKPEPPGNSNSLPHAVALILTLSFSQAFLIFLRVQYVLRLGDLLRSIL